MNFPKELRYTKSHEWGRRDGNRIVVGITDHAQKEISDIVFVELPKDGQAVEQGKVVAIVESVKAAFDIYAPVSGKVSKANRELDSNPGVVNQEPYLKGWLFEIEMVEPAEWDKLLAADDYEKMLRETVK